MAKISVKKILVGLTALGSLLFTTACDVNQNTVENPPIVVTPPVVNPPVVNPPVVNPPVVNPPVVNPPVVEDTYPEIPIVYQKNEAELADVIEENFFSKYENHIPDNYFEANTNNIKNQCTTFYLTGSFSEEQKGYIENAVELLNDTFGKIDSGISFNIEEGSPNYQYDGKSVVVFNEPKTSSYFSNTNPYGVAAISKGSLSPKIYMFLDYMKEYCDTLTGKINMENFIEHVFIHEYLHTIDYGHTEQTVNSVMTPNVSRLIINSEGRTTFCDEDIKHFVYKFSQDRTLEGMYKVYCNVKGQDYSINNDAKFKEDLTKIFSNLSSPVTKEFFNNDGKECNLEKNQIINMISADGKYNITLNKDKIGFYECEVTSGGNKFTFEGQYSLLNNNDLNNKDLALSQIICLKDFKLYGNFGTVKETKNMYFTSTQHKEINAGETKLCSWKSIKTYISDNAIYFEDNTMEYAKQNDLDIYETFQKLSNGYEIIIDSKLKDEFSL